jgi:two-component system nitrogen regulation sensor histidine kinase NtrY
VIDGGARSGRAANAVLPVRFRAPRRGGQLARRAAEGELVHRGLGQQRVPRADAAEAFPDRYLYVSREVDGEILALLDETQETVQLYNQLESERGRVLFEFGLLYLGSR